MSRIDGYKYDIAGPWRKVFSTNSTNNSLADLPTATLPTTSTAGVIELAAGLGAGATPRWLVFRVYGTNANNETVQVKLDGFAVGPGGVYAPEPLVQVTATFSSTLAGPSATSSPTSSEYYADTIAIDTGFGDGESAIVKSPADDKGIAHVLVDVRGYALVKFVVDIGTCDDANVEFRVLA